MGRAITGNKRLIPDGMSPIEWANAVWEAMDDFGISQDEAKKYVQSVWSTVRSESDPPKDKMVRTSIDKRIG
jgi:hypothetical protein|tara:strand:- start:4051 stop:4266 length:216 start_codon:yes stop_codon:yes gene_type:complete